MCNEGGTAEGHSQRQNLGDNDRAKASWGIWDAGNAKGMRGQGGEGKGEGLE